MSDQATAVQTRSLAPALRVAGPQATLKIDLQGQRGRHRLARRAVAGKILPGRHGVHLPAGTGLFPSPVEIALSCSCPDWACMCKHVAAVLYGIGARLDEQPELLFKLREVDGKDLIARAGEGLPLAKKRPAATEVLESSELSEILGLEMAEAPKTKTAARSKRPKPRRTKILAKTPPPRCREP